MDKTRKREITIKEIPNNFRIDLGKKKRNKNNV